MYTRTYFQCPKGRVTVVEDSLDCGASRRAAAASAMARCRSALRAQYVAMRSHHSSSMDVSSTPTNVSRSLATSILMMILRKAVHGNAVTDGGCAQTRGREAVRWTGRSTKLQRS